MTALTWEQTAVPHAAERVRRPAGPAAGAATLRLTARGRTVLVVLGLAVAAWLLGPVGAFAGDRPEAVEVVPVTVSSGDTLWGIAAAVARPDEDVRDVVDRIAALNALEGTAIVQGQQLLVPVQGLG